MILVHSKPLISKTLYIMYSSYYKERSTINIKKGEDNMAVSKYLILALILGLLVLSGCPETDDNNNQIIDSPFIGGSEGLVFKFIENAPPEEVFDTDNAFSVSVRLENVGEHTIPENYDRMPIMKITGIDYADFDTTEADMTKSITEELLGQQLNPTGKVIQGTIMSVEFPTTGEDLQYIGEVAGSAPFTFRAELCYEYETKAQAMLCVREDLLGTHDKEGVCEPNRALQAANSGAPVHVESLEQSVQGPDKIYFDFKVRHVGAGKVFKEGLAEPCSSDTRSNKNKVWVEIEDPNLGDFKCSGLSDGTDTTGYVTLSESSTSVKAEGHVRCTIKLDEPRDLEKLLKIKLKYDYFDYTDTTVEVRHGS